MYGVENDPMSKSKLWQYGCLRPSSIGCVAYLHSTGGTLSQPRATPDNIFSIINHRPGIVNNGRFTSLLMTDGRTEKRKTDGITENGRTAENGQTKENGRTARGRTHRSLYPMNRTLMSQECEIGDFFI